LARIANEESEPKPDSLYGNALSGRKVSLSPRVRSAAEFDESRLKSLSLRLSFFSRIFLSL
jgi:hypothetical protein